MTDQYRSHQRPPDSDAPKDKESDNPNNPYTPEHDVVPGQEAPGKERAPVQDPHPHTR